MTFLSYTKKKIQYIFLKYTLLSEMIKQNNKAMTKNTKGSFELWNEYAKNLLSTSAIIYKFAGENFQKTNVGNDDKIAFIY